MSRAIVSLLVIAFACGAPRAPVTDLAPTTAESSAEAVVVEKLMEAFNRHDVEAMLGLVNPDVQWFNIDGADVTVEANGQAALGQGMRQYFASLPSARSELERVVALGPYVTTRERAHWTTATGPRTQASIAVYEVRDGRVRRVWYFPAVVAR